MAALPLLHQAAALHHPLRHEFGRRAPAVVVTGASSGIGRELARLAAAEGHALVLVAREERPLNELVSELSSRGGSAVGLALDLKQPEAIDRIAECLKSHALYCDILINSAGFGIYGAIAETDPQLQSSLIDVNIRRCRA